MTAGTSHPRTLKHWRYEAWATRWHQLSIKGTAQTRRDFTRSWKETFASIGYRVRNCIQTCAYAPKAIATSCKNLIPISPVARPRSSRCQTEQHLLSVREFETAPLTTLVGSCPPPTLAMSSDEECNYLPLFFSLVHLGS